MQKTDILSRLPVFKNNRRVIVAGEQSIEDIVKDVCKAHSAFKTDYDKIAEQFEGGSIEDICRRLFRFCRANIIYDQEPVKMQTTRSPAATLTMGKGDCKHYAGFIAGVLDAISRKTGKKINWVYRFASYNIFNDQPGHVFVVVKLRGGKEIWIDPVLNEMDARFPIPIYTKDKNCAMSLLRISGVNSGFRSVVQVTRSQARLGDISVDPVVDPVNYYPPPVQPVLSYSGNTSVFNPQGTGDPLSNPSNSGIRYLLDGKDYPFPFNNNPVAPPALPQDLQVIYPPLFRGLTVPAGLPRPICVGNRIILLPKGLDQNILKENNYIWTSFLQAALLPLVRAFGNIPTIGDTKRLSNSPAGDTNLSQAILFDMDSVDVVDYVSMRPTVIPVEAAKPEGVIYYVNGSKLTLPAANNPGSYPPPLPDIITKYPEYYRGLKVPENLPKPVNDGGKLRLVPNEVTRELFTENGNVWAIFVTAVLAPLVNCYSQYPYAYNDNTASKLSDRVWNDCLTAEHVDDYLDPVQAKTWAGEVLSVVGEALEAVGRGILKFVNAGSRLAFLGMVRINLFAWAYKLFISLNDPDRFYKAKTLWRDLGGNFDVFYDAVILGCKNNPILGGGVKQWIEDAVKDGIIENGYTRPVDDTDIGEEVPVDSNGVPILNGVGVVGGDDILYYLAAAAPVIAALAGLIKGIGGAKTDAVVDGVVGGMNLLLTASGEDPIKLAQEMGVPVQVRDPVTGELHTIYPPTQVQGGVFDGVKGFIQTNPITSAVIGAGVAFGIWKLTAGKNKKLF